MHFTSLVDEQKQFVFEGQQMTASEALNFKYSQMKQFGECATNDSNLVKHEVSGVKMEHAAMMTQMMTLQNTIASGLSSITGPKSVKHTSLSERKGADKLEKLLGDSNYTDWSFKVTGFLTEADPRLKQVFKQIESSERDDDGNVKKEDISIAEADTEQWTNDGFE